MNKQTFGYILAFSLGAAAGVAASWKIFKTKYEQRIEEEIESLNKLRSELQSEPTKDEAPDISEERPIEEVRAEYVNIIKEQGYSYQEDMEVGDGIRIISPEEYGDDPGYESETLYYFADGVLIDDQDNPVEDVANTVGLDFPSHFGEYEEDSVHVRNTRLRTDYEILLDVREYSSVVNPEPHLAEDE